MKIIYRISDKELALSDKEIKNGIVEFERSAHYVDNVKAGQGIIRWLPGKLKNINPIGWIYNWKGDIEPFYFLDWKHIHPVAKLKGNEVHFEKEDNYNMDAAKLKTLLHLRMTDNLVTSEGFKLDKKVMLYIALAIGGVIAYWFFFLRGT